MTKELVEIYDVLVEVAKAFKIEKFLCSFSDVPVVKKEELVLSFC